MKNKVTYTLTYTKKSFCPVCNGNVVFYLSHINNSNKKPSFYICFKCKDIHEVGKGPVLSV